MDILKFFKSAIDDFTSGFREGSETKIIGEVRQKDNGDKFVSIGEQIYDYNLEGDKWVRRHNEMKEKSFKNVNIITK